MLIQISTIAAALTDAVCQLLVAVIAEATGTGAGREGTNIANLIHWIHFISLLFYQWLCAGDFPSAIDVDLSAI
ncbi:hypothetical protein, partial [Cronobacter malonaticus]